MGGVQTTRSKIAVGGSVKFAAAHRMMVALVDVHRVVGSHYTYAIGDHRITVSRPRSGELLPYQRRAIHTFLTDHGK